MKLVTVEDLREGDIIANDVLLEDYTVVLSKGTVIKAPYIDKLREMGIFTVYIDEPQKVKAHHPQSADDTKSTIDLSAAETIGLSVAETTSSDS